MSGLIIFLSILAGLLVLVVVVLLILVINVTLKINHTQKNVKAVQARVNDLTEAASVASSAVAFVGSVAGVFKNVGKKKVSSRGKNSRKKQ